MITQEIIIQVLFSFGLFLIVWYVVGNNLFKPFLALLDEREAKTSGAERDAVAVQEKRKERSAELDRILREARVEGITIRDQYVREAKATAQDMLDSASEAAALELEKNRHLIEELKANTRAEVPREAEKLAGQVVERVTGRSQSIH